MISPRLLALPLVLAAAVVGCAPPADTKGKADAGPVKLDVLLPQYDMVKEYEEFTGRTEARQMVEIRARVSGYLKKASFTEGMDVEKDQPLFEIEREPYQAEVERNEGMLAQAEATVGRLGTDYQRASRLSPSRAMSQEEIDKIVGNRGEAQATVAAAKAALRTAKLNLGYTRVVAPFKGRISRRYADPGNLVKADETILTTVVELDPIQAYFDIDERTVLKLRRLVHLGKLQSAREAKIKVSLGLADQEGFPLEGTIDFVDNHLDPGTGTLRIRVLIDNKEKLLSPGMFMRLRLPVTLSERMPLLPDDSLANDQGQKGVYVVNAENKVEYRKIETGQLHNGLRIIKSPLKEKEYVAKYPLQGQTAFRAGKPIDPRPEKGKVAAKDEKAAVAQPVNKKAGLPSL